MWIVFAVLNVALTARSVSQKLRSVTGVAIHPVQTLIVIDIIRVRIHQRALEARTKQDVVLLGTTARMGLCAPCVLLAAPQSMACGGNEAPETRDAARGARS